MNRLLLCVLLVPLGSVGAQGQGELPPEYQAAEKLLAQRQWKAAAQAFEKVIEMAPNDWRPYWKAGSSWARIRRYRKATSLMKMARNVNPEAYQVVYDLASSLYNLGLWAESLVYWRELEILAGNHEQVARHARIPYQRGVCAEKLDLIPEALDAYARALGMASSREQKILFEAQLGGACLNSGRSEQAARYFEELTRLEPSSDKHLYHLGAALMNLGRDDEAEQALLKARKLNDKEANIDLKLGQLYQRRNDHSRAMTFFQESARKNPLGYEPWFGLRAIYNRLGNLDQADEAQARYEELHTMGVEIEEKSRGFHRRVKADPYDIEAYFEHALLFIEHGRMPEAMEKFQQLLAHEPEHELATINLAQIFATQGDFQDAVWEMERLLEKDPEHPIANMEIARSRLRLAQAGQRDQLPLAFENVKRAIPRLDRKSTRYPQALQMLAASAILLRRPTSAIPPLEEGIRYFESDPNNLIPLLKLLASCTSRAGNPAKAIPAFENAVLILGAEHPSYKELITTLVTLATNAKNEEKVMQYQSILEKLK